MKLLPLQGALLIAIIPRALPWAKSFCPFRACCSLELLTFTYPSTSDFQRYPCPLHALKGQKLIAQGSALGIMAMSNAPCKGNSFKYCQEF